MSPLGQSYWNPCVIHTAGYLVESVAHIALESCVIIGLDNALSPISWWRHQMETFSALLAICAGNSLFPGEFPSQRPVTRSFDVFFDLRQNKRLSTQWWGWWFEMPICPLWRHCNVTSHYLNQRWLLQMTWYSSTLMNSKNQLVSFATKSLLS